MKKEEMKSGEDADVTFTPEEIVDTLEALWKANALLKISGVKSDDLDQDEVDNIVDDHDKAVQRISVKLMRMVGRSVAP